MYSDGRLAFGYSGLGCIAFGAWGWMCLGAAGSVGWGLG